MSIRKMGGTGTSGRRDIDASSDPLVHFQRWFAESQQAELPDWVEANAMTLSTADPSGHVTSRIVLLRGVEEGRLCFFTSYDSSKGEQMAANSQVSLCLFWPHQQRQVRMEGRVEKLGRSESEENFHRRLRASQLAVHVSRQSAEVENREVLEQRMRELELKYEDKVIPCPESWGGYQVEPYRFEFWQACQDRLHDRICYKREEGKWTQTRLAP